MGDFSARVQTIMNYGEAGIVGQHTFDKNNPRVEEEERDRADVTENRSLFIAHCATTHTIIANTQFEKTDSKLVAFRHAATKHGPPWSRKKLRSNGLHLNTKQVEEQCKRRGLRHVGIHTV